MLYSAGLFQHFKAGNSIEKISFQPRADPFVIHRFYFARAAGWSARCGMALDPRNIFPAARCARHVVDRQHRGIYHLQLSEREAHCKTGRGRFIGSQLFLHWSRADWLHPCPCLVDDGGFGRRGRSRRRRDRRRSQHLHRFAFRRRTDAMAACQLRCGRDARSADHDRRVELVQSLAVGLSQRGHSADPFGCHLFIDHVHVGADTYAAPRRRRQPSPH